MQAETPAFDTCFFSGGAGGFLGIGWQAGEQRFVGDDFGEGIGCIEDVFRELGREAGELFHDGLKAWFVGFR